MASLVCCGRYPHYRGSCHRIAAEICCDGHIPCEPASGEVPSLEQWGAVGHLLTRRPRRWHADATLKGQVLRHVHVANLRGKHEREHQ